MTAATVTELDVHVAAVVARHESTGTPIAALIVTTVPREHQPAVADVLCSGPSGLTE